MALHVREPQLTLGIGVLAQQPVDLGLAAHVHAARGFLQDQNLRTGGGRRTDDHLLLVAAAERSDRIVHRAGLHPELVGEVLRRRPQCPGMQQSEPVADVGAEAGQQVLAHREVEEEVLGPVRPHEPHLIGGGLGGLAVAVRLRGAVHADAQRAGRRCEARQRVNQRASSGSLHTGDGHDLAASHRHVDVGEAAAAMGPAREAQRIGAVIAIGSSRCGAVGERAVILLCPASHTDDEFPGHPVLRQVIAAEDHPALPVDDHPHTVGVHHQFVQPVRHQDHDASGIGQVVHAAKEILRLLLGQCRVGLVEQEDARILGQGAGDLGALLCRQGEIFEARVSM